MVIFAFLAKASISMDPRLSSKTLSLPVNISASKKVKVSHSLEEGVPLDVLEPPPPVEELPDPESILISTARERCAKLGMYDEGTSRPLGGLVWGDPDGQMRKLHVSLHLSRLLSPYFRRSILWITCVASAGSSPSSTHSGTWSPGSQGP